MWNGKRSLCHEVPDVTWRSDFGIVDDRHFTGTGIPLRVHHASDTLCFGSGHPVRIVAADPESAGLHIGTIGISQLPDGLGIQYGLSKIFLSLLEIVFG